MCLCERDLADGLTGIEQKWDVGCPSDGANGGGRVDKAAAGRDVAETDELDPLIDEICQGGGLHPPWQEEGGSGGCVSRLAA